MKLNLTKCTFGVSSGRFLGYLVTQENPSDPRDETSNYLKGDSKLDRTSSYPQPLPLAIHRSMQAVIQSYQEGTMRQMGWRVRKKYLTSPLLLSKLEVAENLYIYLAVSEVAVSSTLIREELWAQLLVFYTYKAFLDAETRYSMIEKIILELVLATQKLRPYFQAHTVIVMTQYPLRSILHGPNAS